MQLCSAIVSFQDRSEGDGDSATASVKVIPGCKCLGQGPSFNVTVARDISRGVLEVFGNYPIRSDLSVQQHTMCSSMRLHILQLRRLEGL